MRISQQDHRSLPLHLSLNSSYSAENMSIWVVTHLYNSIVLQDGGYFDAVQNARLVKDAESYYREVGRRQALKLI